MPVEELEAALQRGWSFGDLEVYADQLLSTNDPRGHVVAIDLLPRPEQQHWRQRRQAALAAWLGNALAASAGHLVQHGFIHELRDGMGTRQLLRSPAGAFVRGFTTFGTRCRAALVALAEQPRPWLTRLVIANHGEERLSAAEVRALIAATPRLAEVWLLGAPMFDAFEHPAVRRARVDTRASTVWCPDSVTVSRIEAPAYATGATVSAADLELVSQLVELAPDCNQLYTYGAEIADLPALLVRLAAAKLVELDGPIVRAATPGMVLVARQQPSEHEPPTNQRGWIEMHPDYVEITDLGVHTRFLRACLATYPVSARMHDALVDYLGSWRREPRYIEAELMGQFHDAFNALLELRGLFPAVTVPGDGWLLVERLAQPFDGGAGGVFRQYGYY